MRAGKLRHRIALQSFTTSKNAVGEVIESWSTFATVWAAISPLTGRELFYAQQVSTETVIKITVRYNATVDTKSRVKFGTDYFEINSVINPDSKNEYLELMCKEVT